MYFVFMTYIKEYNDRMMAYYFFFCALICYLNSLLDSVKYHILPNNYTAHFEKDVVMNISMIVLTMYTELDIGSQVQKHHPEGTKMPLSDHEV